VNPLTHGESNWVMKFSTQEVSQVELTIF